MTQLTTNKDVVGSFTTTIEKYEKKNLTDLLEGSSKWLVFIKCCIKNIFI